jgi:hypothetical protein
MNKHRKLALAVLASITIAGIAGASASSLGGIGSASIGSDDAITASCQTTPSSIKVTYNTSYNSTAGRYDVGTVTFSGVDTACNGLKASLVLADAAKASLTSVTGATVGLTSGSFTLDVPDVSAKLVENLSLVIQG